MEFVWSDDLAMLLVDVEGTPASQVTHWLSRPIGYRLPEDTSPLTFGRLLLESEHGATGSIERFAAS